MAATVRQGAVNLELTAMGVFRDCDLRKARNTLQRRAVWTNNFFFWNSFSHTCPFTYSHPLPHQRENNQYNLLVQDITVAKPRWKVVCYLKIGLNLTVRCFFIVSLSAEIYKPMLCDSPLKILCSCLPPPVTEWRFVCSVLVHNEEHNNPRKTIARYSILRLGYNKTRVVNMWPDIYKHVRWITTLCLYGISIPSYIVGNKELSRTKTGKLGRPKW